MCNREGHSYTQLSQNFPKQTNEGANEISINNINKEWVSVPSGSEHYTFTNMRKNQYEEALFKVILMNNFSVKMKSLNLISLSTLFVNVFNI